MFIKHTKLDNKIFTSECKPKCPNSTKETWTAAQTSPAQYKTFGGFWPGFPETNIAKGQMWHSSDNIQSRGLTVTFEYPVIISRFLGMKIFFELLK